MTVDPFAQNEKIPSVSFKDKPIGTRIRGKVVEAPQTIQARDFDTGDLAFWPDGNKKLTVVTGLEINGERFNLWAPKPSAMFRALADAQAKAGAQIAVDGWLTIDFTGEQPNEKNPRLNAQKLYSAIYEPNDPFAAGEQSINPQTGEVTGNGPQPEWSLPQQPQAAGSVQQMTSPYATTTAQPQQPVQQVKQHSAETIAALKAAGLDPAKVPVL